MPFKRMREGEIGWTLWEDNWVYWSVGGNPFGKGIRGSEFEQSEQLQAREPALVAVDDRWGRALWWYKEEFYLETSACPQEEAKLLLRDKVDRRRRKVERLRKGFLSERGLEQARRERIPEDVRIFVWKRDEGRCVQCGSRENLEFDHVIPVSKGGSNTARNIQLLCETCNREKLDSI